MCLRWCKSVIVINLIKSSGATFIIGQKKKGDQCNQINFLCDIKKYTELLLYIKCLSNITDTR